VLGAGRRAGCRRDPPPHLNDEQRAASAREGRCDRRRRRTTGKTQVIRPHAWSLTKRAPTSRSWRSLTEKAAAERRRRGPVVPYGMSGRRSDLQRILRPDGPRAPRSNWGSLATPCRSEAEILSSARSAIELGSSVPPARVPRAPLERPSPVCDAARTKYVSPRAVVSSPSASPRRGQAIPRARSRRGRDREVARVRRFTEKLLARPHRFGSRVGGGFWDAVSAERPTCDGSTGSDSLAPRGRVSDHEQRKTSSGPGSLASPPQNVTIVGDDDQRSTDSGGEGEKPPRVLTSSRVARDPSPPELTIGQGDPSCAHRLLGTTDPGGSR